MMSNINLLERIDAYIIKGKLPQAIELLIQVCQDNESENISEVKLLSSQFYTIERKEKIGLGEFNQEINRIAKAVLSILDEEKTLVKPLDSEALSLEEKLSIIEEKIDKLSSLMSHKEQESDFEIEREYFWKNLEESSRNYLQLAEQLYHNEDILFDYSSAVIQYAKAIENEFVNKIQLPYQEYLNVQKGASEEVSMEIGHSIIISDIVSLQTLIQSIQNAITAGNKTTNSLYQFISDRFSVVNIKALSEQLNGIAEVRNSAAHIGVISQREAGDFREKILLVLRNFLNRPYRIT